MDKSKQICPQHLDNSGELSTYQQYDDDTNLQEGGSFLTNIEGGTPLGGRSAGSCPTQRHFKKRKSGGSGGGKVLD
jgi:hypothetical protein